MPGFHKVLCKMRGMGMKMRALIWTENFKLEKREVTEPVITTPTDVKVKICLTGICGTDLSVIAGKEKGSTGIIRGHEAVGTVTETGSAVEKVAVGDRVVIDPNQYCGKCYYCRRGETNLCCGTDKTGMKIAGLNINGTFAEYYVSDEKFIYRIPDNMDWETALMVEPLACVLHNFMEAGVRPDDSVLVIGSGPMGILCQLVSNKLCRLTVAVEREQFRLDFAKGVANFAFKPEEIGISKILEINSGRKFNIVIDAVGNQLELAEEYTERGGKIILLGLNPTYNLSFSPAKHSGNAIKIFGCGEYNCLFETAVSLASALPALKTLVTKKYSFDEYKTAINELLGYDLDTKNAIKGFSVKTALYP